MELGAFPSETQTLFRVWAPRTPALSVEIEGGPTVPMRRADDGTFEVAVEGVRPGARYCFLFPDGRRRADPASRLQEESVHGASTVVDLAFPWSDAGWRGVEVEGLVTYELHVGTFTPEGTLEAIIPRLPRLRELGVTALELMPLAAWDGPRGWGYDGVLLYAVHSPYGGPKALQRLVDAAHAQGLAVLLDVVYNHLGPSGNYLRDFGPFFTDKHHTPWGEAVNYDGEGSRGVREFVVQNALSWIRDFHLDGLRLDAVHGIVDDSRPHILRELNDRVQALAAGLGRRVPVIAESDLNDPRVVGPVEAGGFGLASQWSDDFHHALHTLLTGERAGYYQDFGTLEHLAKAYRQAFVMAGEYSQFRKKRHGAPPKGLPGRRFVVAAQNHDQIGNRPRGDRLAATLAPEAQRLAAAATILSPFLPLLYMGEEYGETAPFQYFTSFPDRALGRAVSEGRKREFKEFAWAGEVPDPQDPETFARSRIDLSKAEREPHAGILRFYRAVIALRRSEPLLRDDRLEEIQTAVEGQTLSVQRPGGALLVLRFSKDPGTVQLPPGTWRVSLDGWARKFDAGGRWELPATATASLALGPWHAALLTRIRD